MICNIVLTWFKVLLHSYGNWYTTFAIYGHTICKKHESFLHVRVHVIFPIYSIVPFMQHNCMYGHILCRYLNPLSGVLGCTVRLS